ncbi:MAG: hypothetical protein KAT06_03765, partial [Gammaproteobacteria bacterium]|nr:hypothetical protein [Gammaproteobacteria bacterium]
FHPWNCPALLYLLHPCSRVLHGIRTSMFKFMSTPRVFPRIVCNNTQGTFELIFHRAPHLG